MTDRWSQNDRLWALAAIALVVVAGVGLRLGTRVLDTPAVFDEPFIRGPIEDLLHEGWTVKTAIDFKETKGPTLIWTYALFGEVLGDDLNDFRLTTVLFFIGSVVPLLLIARRIDVHGPGLVAVAALYALMPYNAVLGQLLMSEATFVFGTLWLYWVFLWGFGDDSTSERRVLGPLLFGLILSLLLHNRVHAVAYAGAVALIAFERDRWRSWPWWLGCVLAGASRIPLWMRWGGLVHPDYQSMHHVGFRLDSLSYLAAAFVPFLVAFLWPALRERRWRRNLAFILPTAGIGLVLAVVAQPNLAVFAGATERFQGVIAGVITRLDPNSSPDHIPTFVRIAMTLLATIGLASLGALASLSWRKSDNESDVGLRRTALCGRLMVWTLATGWGLYAFTQGWVFDRYLLPWAILLPLLWLKWLPRWMLTVQAIGLSAIVTHHTLVWLFHGGPHGLG